MKFEVAAMDIGNISSIYIGENDSLVIESRKTEYQKMHDNGTNDIVNTSKGKFVVELGYFENDNLKFEKENFIDLVHYGLAKVTTEENIKLSMGIPAGQYNKYRDVVKEKIMNNNKIDIEINGKRIVRYINEVIVTPEGYGLFKTTPKEMLIPNAKSLVVDIGGGTTDIAEFSETGQFIDGKSIQVGLLNLYQLVSLELNVPVEDAKKYFDGDLVLPSKDVSFKDPNAKIIVKDIINRLKGLYPNIKNYNIIVCGGGAKVFGDVFEALINHAIVRRNIKLTAESYKAIGDVKWQEK
ncbi:MAG: ParM/StbA family protein [Paraclostridium sp.]